MGFAKVENIIFILILYEISISIFAAVKCDDRD